MRSLQQTHRAFKHSGAGELFDDYKRRLVRFVDVSVTGLRLSENSHVWLCDRSKPAKILSSEEVAVALRKVQNSGVKDWCVLIGPPDGFSEDQIVQNIQPKLRWSFGHMTLPHELAAVVAVEQIYRAYEINRGGPYHGGH